MRNIYRGFWFILFVLFTLNETAISNSARFWAICSSDEQCQNGGHCFENSCVCDYGYTGSNCEAKLQCNDFNCVNNGTCELDLQTNKTFCSCNQHPVSEGRFEGVFCEKRVPCHALGYCLNGGLCQRDPYVTDAFFCKCRDGFIGPVCRERTSCFENKDCLHGGVCDFNMCLCDKNSGYTGYFCELQVTPALNSSSDFYWALNRQSSAFKGAAKVVRNPQMGNVLSLLQAGGGWANLGQFDNRCIKDFDNCQQGISISFWLQFIDGMYVVAITNANTTILSVRVKEYRNLHIQLTAGLNRWQIKRSCFPVGWFFLTITWNHTNILYYENGQLLSESPPPAQVNYSSPPDASLLTVGGLNGKGGFSTMRMSDLALWTRVLSKKEVKDNYLKKFSSPIIKRCLSNPCPSNQWCEDDSSGSGNFTCIEPAGFYCSFDSDYCQWQNASSNNQHWVRFSEFGSLRHDHTSNSCAGSGKFLGLIAQGVAPGGKLSSDIISRPFPRPSVPGNNVFLSMWYYMEGWTRNKLYFLIQSSTGNQTVLIHLSAQSRRWKHLKLQFVVKTTFQVLLRGELNGSGGIFLDDISVETFSSPVIIQEKTNHSSSLHDSVSMNCSVYNSINITWYHGNNRIKQGETYTIFESVVSNKNVSVLSVSNLNCQVAGNYTCVAANDYGSDQRQFTLNILDVPRPPSNVMIDSTTKQITWAEVAGYECLPESHFVVEYKKDQSVNWTTAGYFDNRTLDLANVSKGERYDVRIYAKNLIGRSPPSKVITFWTNIESSEIQLFVDKVAVQGSNTIFLRRGVKVNLRCETKAEPRPSFSWIFRWRNLNISAYGPGSWVSGIKWQRTFVITSLNCHNSGNYQCRPKNVVSQRVSSSVAIQVTEPDPPKTFSVFFVNITSVLISWSAYTCNYVYPTAMMIRYRQEGATAWIKRPFKLNLVTDLVLTGQFEYKTVYEFSSRLMYEGRYGVYSPVIKTLSPELKVFFYNVSFKILSEVYRRELGDSQSVEFIKLSKEVSKLVLQAVPHLPEPKDVKVISFKGPGNTTAHFQFSIAYSNTLLLEWMLRTFIRVNNKQNGALQIDADTLAIVQEPECQNALGMENDTISDGQISASSQWNSDHAAIQSRLNFKANGRKSGAWSALHNNVNQWLQIDLIGQNTRVTRVATQGRNDLNQWVTKYKLEYSNDGVNFQYYREQGQTDDKVFAGNTDRDTIVSHDLNPPIRARYIRFRPVAWYNHISMRVELYDCPQDLAHVTMTIRFSGQAGTTMTIYCTAFGPTTSNFTWTKDHVTLQPSYRVKYDVNSTCSALTVRMTKKADSGNYTCKVSNSWTSLQETVSVRVAESPRVHIRPFVRTLFEGDSVTFQCYLSRGNISRLHVTWYEKVGNSQEKLISSNNDSFALTVKGTPADSMENHVILYRCFVRNTDGLGSSPSAKLVILRHGDKAVCAREVSSGVTWTQTSAGMNDIQQCPNATGTAVRPCLKVGHGAAQWGQVNFSNCMSYQIMEIHNEILAVTEGYTVNRTLSDILEDLESVTAAYSAPRPGENSRSMYKKDLAASVDALTRLIIYNAANRTRPLSNNHDISNLVKTSSNLLELSNLPAWKTALKTEDDLAYKMVSALDEYGHHSINKTRDIHIQADNVVLMAVKVSVNSSAASEGLRMIHGQSSLDLLQTFFSQTNTSVTIVSVIFSTLGNVLTNAEALKELNTFHFNGSRWFLNSRLASITVRPRPPDVIRPPFKLALETNKVTIASNKRVCVYLNLSGEHNKAWSTEGCSVVSSQTNSTTTTCACDHMTLFAVLMDASSDTRKDASHRTALSWISIVGCMISLIGILITLLVMFCFWKNLRSPRTRVLVNLCVAIAVTDALIVAMEIADVQNQTGCTVLAALLHFFILSIFCWMLSEAVQLYFSIVKVIGAAADAHMRVFYCLGWGLPTLVVAVSMAVTQGHGYADAQSCWLSTRNHILWAFVVPALLIVSGNIVVFALIIYSMLSSHRLRKEPLTRRFQRGLKASIVLLPLLGISWSFGVLTMTSDKIVFNYIFAIFNSLQGFLIFIFHCVFDKQIRDVLNDRKRKRTGFVTDAMTAYSNRKLSTTTNTTQGTNSRLNSATPLRILNLQMFRSVISPSPPHPSPTFSRAFAFEETSLVSASTPTPRAERHILIQGHGEEKREEKQEFTDHTKDEITRGETCRPITPSLNTCDMDERDWTSLESSSESSVECSADEEMMDKVTSRAVKC